MSGSMLSVMFQFHTGSIKSNNQERIKGDTMKFQFHTGSIKSDKCHFVVVKRICFNSILVRLKVQPVTNYDLFLDGFNSILVRLKVQHLTTHVQMLCRCFNSILVRLKVRERVQLRPEQQGFNSILVRLKDGHDARANIPCVFVSIPYWFD